MHTMFGVKHLIILAICAVALATGFYFARKKQPYQLAKTLLLIGLVSEIIKIFYYTMANEATHGGVLPKTDLPFHLCSIQILFFAVQVYAKNEKLKEAKNILSASDTPLRNVSEMLGFSNEYNFIRFFKETEGIPPGQFRKILKNKEQITI